MLQWNQMIKSGLTKRQLIFRIIPNYCSMLCNFKKFMIKNQRVNCSLILFLYILQNQITSFFTFVGEVRQINFNLECLMDRCFSCVWSIAAFCSDSIFGFWWFCQISNVIISTRPLHANSSIISSRLVKSIFVKIYSW